MGKGKVLPGIDSFIAQGLFSKERIGLITNQTGITVDGAPTWKALINKGYNISALFGPEHGFRGEAQDAVKIEDSTFMGIKTYSLYGRNLAPTSEMLENIDILLYDIQDVGCRYYTYLYTLAYAMEACEKNGKNIIVLDRPNPIGHFPVEGNRIDEEYNTFVGGYGLTNIYGMTVGEFAQYLKKYYFASADLTVIPIQNYTRTMKFRETGLPWISPSPNMPSLNSAYTYPGTCLFEGTNISEGRGTTRPFEIIGAPWIDAEKLREALFDLNLPGVVFTSLFFTPVFSKYKNEPCQGVGIHILDNNIYKPLFTGLAILHTIYSLYPEKIQWKRDWENEGQYFFDKLSGTGDARIMFGKNDTLENIYSQLSLDSDKFQDKRKKILIYPDN